MKKARESTISEGMQPVVLKMGTGMQVELLSHCPRSWLQPSAKKKVPAGIPFCVKSTHWVPTGPRSVSQVGKLELVSALAKSGATHVA